MKRVQLNVFLFNFFLFFSSCVYGAINLIIEPSKSVVSETETNVFYVTVENTTSATETGISVEIQLPAGVTETSYSAPGGTSYTAGIPGTSPGIWTIESLSGNAQLSMQLFFNHNDGISGLTVTSQAEIVSGSVSVGEVASTQVIIGCAFFDWSSLTIDGGSNLFLSGQESHTEDFSSQGFDIVLDAFNQGNQSEGSDNFTLYLTSAGNLGRVLQLGQNWREPYDQNAAVTIAPPEYSEAVFTFDSTVYPNGVSGIAFAIYDIDTGSWRDGTIVFGTSVTGDSVYPSATLSSVADMNVFSMMPPIIASNGSLNFSNDDPRGRVTYTFSEPIRSLTIRYYNQVSASGQTGQIVYLSNLYRGCPTDLDLSLDVTASNVNPCDVFSYTVEVANLGPNDSNNVIVTGLLPAGLTFVSAIPSQGMFNSSTGVWTVGSLLRPSETPLDVASITIQATVDPTAANTTISGAVEIIGDGEDSNIANNIDYFSIVVGAAELPIAVDDGGPTAYQTSIIFDVMSNDSGCGLDPSTVMVISEPGNGSTSVNVTTGEITYTPANGFSGVDAFVYQVCDANSQCATTTVTVIVAPQVEDDWYSIPFESELIFIEPWDNDLGSGVDSSTMTIVSQPANGVAEVIPESKLITYKPDSGFSGVDTFTYQVCNTAGQGCDIGTINIIVEPEANDNSYDIPVNTGALLNVFSNDSGSGIDASTITILTDPTNGTAQFNSEDNLIEYTPNNNFTGADSFIYQICNSGNQGCDTAVVTVNVNRPPLAVDDIVKTFCRVSAEISVLDNDADPDNNIDLSLTQVISDPQYGRCLINTANGVVTYTPNRNFMGIDQFTYRVFDTFGASDDASAFITVEPDDELCFQILKKYGTN